MTDSKTVQLSALESNGEQDAPELGKIVEARSTVFGSPGTVV